MVNRVGCYERLVRWGPWSRGRGLGIFVAGPQWWLQDWAGGGGGGAASRASAASLELPAKRLLGAWLLIALPGDSPRGRALVKTCCPCRRVSISARCCPEPWRCEQSKVVSRAKWPWAVRQALAPRNTDGWYSG